MDEHKREVFASLEKPFRAAVEKHQTTVKMWTPDEALFPSGVARDQHREELRDAAQRVPLSVRAGFALSALTETGLPSFHRLLDRYLNLETFFGEWIFQWTAEEDRHAQTLFDLTKASGLIPDLAAFERHRFEYNRAGFRPDWESDPYQLPAYTALQEPATLTTYVELVRRFKELGAEALCRSIGYVMYDEIRHADRYRELVGGIMERDPDNMLVSLYKVVSRFEMPGCSMPQYAELKHIAMKIGIFGPAQFAGILRKLLESWRVSDITPKTADAARAKDRLFRIIPKFEEHGRRVLQAEPRTFTFPFLGNVAFEI